MSKDRPLKKPDFTLSRKHPEALSLSRDAAPDLPSGIAREMGLAVVVNNNNAKEEEEVEGETLGNGGEALDRAEVRGDSCAVLVRVR